MEAIKPSSPVALSARGLLEALQANVPVAKETLTRCLAITTRASGCWQTLIRLAIGGGECHDAEDLARRALAAEAGTGTFERMLAEAIYAAGGAPEAVHSALAGGWDSNPDNPMRAKDEASLFILQGRSRDAIKSLSQWTAIERSSRYAKTHMWPAYRTGLLLLELQRPKDAVAVAEEYLQNKAAWLPGDYADDWINLVRVEYFAKAITKNEFAMKRDEWLRAESRRSEGIFARALQWVKAYALAVTSPEDARESLAALAQFGPLPTGPLRSPDQQDAIGYTYLLAVGRPDEALPYLRQATRSCAALDWPIEQTWSYQHLGMDYEALGDPEGACEAYGAITRRWNSMAGYTIAFC